MWGVKIIRMQGGGNNLYPLHSEVWGDLPFVGKIYNLEGAAERIIPKKKKRKGKRLNKFSSFNNLMPHRGREEWGTSSCRGELT